jgi:hypothetical protein
MGRPLMSVEPESSVRIPRSPNGPSGSVETATPMQLVSGSTVLLTDT